MLFINADIAQAWPFIAALGDDLRAAGGRETRLVTVCRPVVRGTDLYATELW